MNLNDLVDYSIIEAARDKFKASALRIAAAKADLAAKQSAVDDAEQALTAAIANLAAGQHGGPTPVEAQAAVDLAARARDLAQRVYDATSQANDIAVSEHHAAQGKAWRPVLRFAAEESIAACDDYAIALASLRAALARKDSANLIAHKAISNGARLGFDGAWLEPKVAHHTEPRPPEFTRLLKPSALERSMWVDGGVL